MSGCPRLASSTAQPSLRKLSYQLLPIEGTKVRMITLKGEEKGPLAVRWIGGLEKWKPGMTALRAWVLFDRLDANGQAIETAPYDILLTHLGALRVGTVWVDGVPTRQRKFERRDIDVSFDSANWRVVSPRQFKEETGQSLQPPDFEFPYKNLELSKLIEFSWGGNKKLYVPCLEFFLRCYGRSAEVKRVLSMYPWEQAKDMLFSPDDPPNKPGTWSIKLRRGIHNDDALFLAHVRHDGVAEKAARSVYEKLERDYRSRQSDRFLFLEAGPWHGGPATLIVEGLDINADAFLALRILGCSHPSGVPIESHRDNPRRAEEPAPDDAPERTYRGSPGHIDKGSDPPNLTDESDPDQTSPSVEFLDPDFIVPGGLRTVCHVPLGQAKSMSKSRSKSGSGTRPKRDLPGAFSAGERHGVDRNTGLALIHSENRFESQGVLRDMWEAMRYLARTYPNEFKSVTWYHPVRGFQSGNEPVLVPFSQFGEVKRGGIRTWAYVDVDPPTPRGALVARVETPDKIVVFVEIQRRRKRSKQTVETKFTEEYFQGLVVPIKPWERRLRWLDEVMDRLRYHEGVAKPVLKDCSLTEAASFNHLAAKNEKVPGLTALANGLSKVGIEIPDRA